MFLLKKVFHLSTKVYYLSINNVCHPEMFTPQRRFYSCLKMTFAKVITAPIRAGKWMEAAHQVNTFLKGKKPNVLVINKTVSCLNNLIFQLLWTGEFGMIMLISESAAYASQKLWQEQ